MEWYEPVNQFTPILNLRLYLLLPRTPSHTKGKEPPQRKTGVGGWEKNYMLIVRLIRQEWGLFFLQFSRFKFSRQIKPVYSIHPIPPPLTPSPFQKGGTSRTPLNKYPSPALLNLIHFPFPPPPSYSPPYIFKHSVITGFHNKYSYLSFSFLTFSFRALQ